MLGQSSRKRINKGHNRLERDVWLVDVGKTVEMGNLPCRAPQSVVETFRDVTRTHEGEKRKSISSLTISSRLNPVSSSPWNGGQQMHLYPHWCTEEEPHWLVLGLHLPSLPDEQGCYGKNADDLSVRLVPAICSVTQPSPSGHRKFLTNRDKLNPVGCPTATSM